MVTGVQEGLGMETKVIHLSHSTLESGDTEKIIRENIPLLLKASEDKIFVGDDQAAFVLWGDLRERKVSAILWVPCKSTSISDLTNAITNRAVEKVSEWLRRDSAWLKCHDEVAAAIIGIRRQSVYLGIAAPNHGGYYEYGWPADTRTTTAMK
jgi:hypothetical protein